MQLAVCREGRAVNLCGDHTKKPVAAVEEGTHRYKALF